MTECIQSRFEFAGPGRRQVVAQFDGGALLLRQTDRRLNLLARAAACFDDHREPSLIHHRVEQLLAQRVYGLALGYEDLSDHDQLREDPLFGLLSGKQQPGEQLGAGKSTLNRLELTSEEPSRYKKIVCRQQALDELLTALFVEAHRKQPKSMVLDLDVTDMALHGNQEGGFFHGYYDSYCYLPLYIFSGEQVLCARLRTADQDAAAGSVEEVERIVKQIRGHWPRGKIVLRADAGFCREELMAWCERNGVDYVFGLARNERLRAEIEEALAQAAEQQRATGKAARVFCEFEYQTRESWSRARRVVAKAEQLEGRENPRYVVTSLSVKQWPARRLYEELYCARGEMENRIKEQLWLFADRVSAATLRANQLRLSLSALAYVLVEGLRRLGLKGTAWARAQAPTIRTRLLKIAARIRITTRKVWISLASSYPLQTVFQHAWRQLRC